MKTKILSKSLYRVLTALLSAAMIMASVTLPVLAEGESFQQNFAETYDVGGNGSDSPAETTEGTVYEIKTAQDLANLGGQDIVGTIELAADIDMSGVDMQPIKSLTGSFFGNGYKISNLTISKELDKYATETGVSLFEKLSGDVKISDVIIENPNITLTSAKSASAAVFADEVSGDETVEFTNCGIVDGSVKGICNKSGYSSATIYAGSFLGNAKYSSVAMKNCFSTSKVEYQKVSKEDTSYIGGLIGCITGTTLNVQNSAVLADVTAGGSSGYCGGLVGGIIGSTSNVTFKDSFFANTVAGLKKFRFAYNGTSSYSKPVISVENCYYNSDNNKSASAYSKVECFSQSVTGTVEGKTTEEFADLEIDGFTVKNGYPYPDWYVNKDGKHTLIITVSPSGAVPTLVDENGNTVDLTQNEDNTDKYTCQVVSGKYTLTVTPPSGDAEHGTKTTDVYFGRADKTIDVVLTARTYNITFDVTPFSAELDLYEGTSKDGEKVLPSQEGTNSYVLTAGEYFYEVSDFGYVTKTGVITVSEDSDIVISLDETERYSFKFNIYPSTAGAALKLTRADGDKREMSARSGCVYSLPEGEYDYEVKADGYKTKRGTISVPKSDELTLTLVSGNSWDGDIAEGIAGDGTSEKPYEISNGAELAYIAKEISENIGSEYAKAYYVLKNDIDLGYQVWTPIGRTSVTAFKGHFDGHGHKISGLNVSDTNKSVYVYYGLFGCLTNAEVKNLTVYGEIYCAEGSANVGGVAACATGNTTVSNCASAVSVSAKAGASVGGIVGLCMKDSDIGYQWIDNAVKVTGCMNKGNILMYGEDRNQFSQGAAGGIVGYSKNCVQIENSCNLGSVTGANIAAGICGNMGSSQGDNSHPYLKNCYNAGSVTGKLGAYPIYKGSLGQSYVTNCYSVATGTEENKYVEIKTADELKSTEVLNELNSGAQENKVWEVNEDINSGYPYLKDVTVPEGDKKMNAEAEKYTDVLAISSDANIGDEFSFIRDGQSADAAVTIKALTDSEYLTGIADGKIRLVKKNETTAAITETVTLLFTSDEGQIRREAKVVIAPEKSSRQKLMNTLAGIYASKTLPDEWVVFDMAAYNRVNTADNAPKISEDAKQNYINLAIDSLNQSYTLTTDRAKAEVIMNAIGVDSTKLYPVNSNTPINNAELLRKESFGDDYSTAIWTLLADLQGNVNLDKSQVKTLVNALLKNQNENGLFSYRYGLNTYTDVDSTGWALAALARFIDDSNDTYGVKADAEKFINKALKGLSSELNENGSYGNINSDSMVITGLIALGINPGTDSRFVKNGCSLADAPMLYVNSAANGFVSDYVSGEQGEKLSAQATEQGFRGLVALETFEKGGQKAYNIYVPTEVTDGEPSEPSQPNPQPGKKSPGKATGTGSVETPAEPSESAKSIKVGIDIKGLNGSWINISDREVKSGSAVYHLLKDVAAQNDITVEGLNKGYVKSMTYKGETLSEYGKGQNSGWLYYVNGELPQVGINDYILKDGDKVEFRYTVDYTTEPGTGSMSGGKRGSSGGTVSASDQNKNDDTLKPNENNGNSAVSFDDVKADDWYYKAISFVCGKNIMRGTGEKLFEPDGLLNRAMFVTILYRMESEPAANAAKFSDVKNGEWYTKAVAWASENGIVNGVSDSEFAPEDNITREQMAAIIYRYIKFKGEDVSVGENTNILSYDDVEDISEYAIPAFCYVGGAGIMSGRTQSTLDPIGTATRAEAATVIMRMFDNGLVK